ncbi:MAG: hypothetical protein ACO3K7_04590, partial [Candidatus Marinamargulisbacteria bacterium]
SVTTLATGVFELAGGPTSTASFSSGRTYALNYIKHHKHRLAYELGTSFYQGHYKGSTLTQWAFPYAGIRYYIPLKKRPISFHVGIGARWVTLSPEFMGKHYVSPRLNIGFNYRLSPTTYLTGDYRTHYGDTLMDHVTQSFDGQTWLLGIGFSLSKKIKPRRPKKQSSYTPKFNQKRINQPQKKQPSTYQQTQKLMNNLSWPTY